MSFFQATSDTLPTVDFEMALSYLGSNISFSSAEFRGVKAGRAARPDYGDKAVGWVELKREGPICHVRAKITPEHKIKNKPYKVEAVINEVEGIVVSAQCEGCAASQGGCKHAIAFLFWLHRRSEEPSPTEVVCYWRRSSMAALGNVTHSPLEDLVGEKVVKLPQQKVKLLQEAKDFFGPSASNMLSLNWRDVSGTPVEASMNNLIIAFKETHNDFSVENFLTFAQERLSPNLCASVTESTADQADLKLWFELRYARVTASSIWSCSRYKKGNVLIDSILGCNKPIETTAMKKGKFHEPHVLEVLRKLLKIPLRKSGLIISREYPFLGASPDAICDDFVVEIKCPLKKETVKNYIKGGIITACCKAQIQLQMKLSGKRKGLFVVSEPTSEINRELRLIWIAYDEAFTTSLIESAKLFWSMYIFPELVNMY